MDINVSVIDGNNIVCQVTPTPQEVITIDRGVAGVGIASITPVTIATLQYLRITYTNGVVQDVGPLTSTAYFGETPIQITGNTISLTTVPIALGGTGETTANAGFNALAPSQTGNNGKYLTTDGTNTSWATNPLGTVTSVDASGGTTGLTFSGGPITTSGTLTLAGILAITNGGTGSSTATGAPFALKGANSDITSMSGITGAIGTADYVQFDTTYATTLGVGQLGWDGNNTLGIGMFGGNVVQRIGEDFFYYIKASSAITKGESVMFTGSVGASGVVSGAPASGVTDGSYIMGIAAENIALNGFGLIQFQGTLKGLDTSAFTDGAILWYNPAVTGGLTATKPSAPNVKVQMAAVIHAGNGGSGSILIRVSAGSVLGGTDSNVEFGTLAANNLIQYNGTYWANIAPSALTGVGSLANALTIGTGLSGASYNGSSAVTISIDSTVATLTGSQTLTNKTISGSSNTLSNIGNSSLTNSSITINGSSVSLGGSTTVTATATNALTIGTGLSGTSYNGSSAVTIAIDSTVATLSGSQTLTNKTISGSSNTLSNIGNSSLTNSSITIGGTSISLGGSTSSIANNLTISGLTVGKGAGSVSTNTAVGASALAANTTGASNDAFGQQALSANTTANYNAAFGRFSLSSNTTGSNNIAMGTSALSSNTTGSYNTAIGFQAAASNVTGPRITAVGNQAGYYTTGGYNSYFGDEAGYGANSGTNNVGLGYGAFSGSVNNTGSGSYNTAVGSLALTNQTTASNNTAVGYQAGYSQTTGGSTAGYNSFIGRAAGYSATGYQNTFVGNVAGYYITSGNSNTIVGAYNGNQGGLDIRTASNYIVLSDGDGNPRGIFDSSGNLLVGVTTATQPDQNFAQFRNIGGPSGVNCMSVGHVTGTASGVQYAYFVYGGGAIGSISQSGTTAVVYNTTSDYRLKENVQPMTNALAKVAALKPCTYTWKSAPDEIGEGFIAHELAEVCPQAVTGEKDAVETYIDEEGVEQTRPKYQGIDTSFLVATLTAAIQEQQQIIQQLQADVAALKGQA